jgi:hypothetical protein
VELGAEAAPRDQPRPDQSAGHRAFWPDPRVERPRRPRDRSTREQPIAHREVARELDRHPPHRPLERVQAPRRQRRSRSPLTLIAESLGRESEADRASRATPRPVEDLLESVRVGLARELGEQVLLHRLPSGRCSSTQHSMHIGRNVLDLHTRHYPRIAPKRRHYMHFGVESGAARTRTWNRRFWRPVP